MNLYDIDSEKLHEHFSFKVDLGQNPLRVDKFLMLRVENATRNKIQKAALNGSIMVNNLPDGYQVLDFTEEEEIYGRKMLNKFGLKDKRLELRFDR